MTAILFWAWYVAPVLPPPVLGGPSTSRCTYRQTSNISHTWVGDNIADNSDVVGALPVGAAPTISSFWT